MNLAEQQRLYLKAGQLYTVSNTPTAEPLRAATTATPEPPKPDLPATPRPRIPIRK
jgi:hypothetical protein